MSVDFQFKVNNQKHLDEASASRDFEPVEEGKYILEIVRTQRKRSNNWQKDGDTENLMISWRIVEGPNKGRYVFDYLGLWNSDPKKCEYAENDFSRIMAACGKQQIQNTAELNGIPVKATVLIRPANGDYSASNYTKYWKQHVVRNDAPMPGQTMPQAAPQAPQAAAPTPQGQMPWNNQNPSGGQNTPFG